jgi:hypothetical protein
MKITMKRTPSLYTLALLAFLAGQLLFAASEKSASVDQTLYGYISCSLCAAKGATTSHRECMEKCLAKGADVVLITDDDQHVLRIDNPDAVREHHAEHVALYGYTSGEAFHVISVRIL